MATELPPPPINVSDNNAYVWLEWFRKLRNYLTTSGSVPWALVDKAGSNLTDLATRNHSNLQGLLPGGTAGYHLNKILHASTVFDFPNITAGTTSTTTVSVTGAAVGDAVVVNPDSVIEAGINIYGYVSAANTVTIVAANPSAGAVNPVSRTYYVTVFKG